MSGGKSATSTRVSSRSSLEALSAKAAPEAHHLHDRGGLLIAMYTSDSFVDREEQKCETYVSLSGALGNRAPCFHQGTLLLDRSVTCFLPVVRSALGEGRSDHQRGHGLEFRNAGLSHS